ncbi:unnamed protein product [Arabis nemorensis]|uniref:Uncharacterized protein n=1 Tax=Arabis nemorensis TaxID=586526 RepID=A0A565BRA8_9BRAS|nr:unnamed protein product [Arabis nemorensis]
MQELLIDPTPFTAFLSTMDHGSNAELAEAKAEVEDLNASLVASNGELGEVKAALVASNAELAKTKAEVVASNAEIAALKAAELVKAEASEAALKNAQAEVTN